MLVALPAIVFLTGLLAAFASLFIFERQVQARRSVERSAVRATLRQLIAAGLISGVGIGWLGLTAFVAGRSGDPSTGAYVWAVVFLIVAVIGWPAILVSAFMIRVNSLDRLQK